MQYSVGNFSIALWSQYGQIISVVELIDFSPILHDVIAKTISKSVVNRIIRDFVLPQCDTYRIAFQIMI
jgi:hypothetical protein